MSVLRDAFVDELRDVLDAERQLLKALPKMAEAAENEQLRAAFTQHEEETRQQISRLGQVFGAFEEQPEGKRCKGMEGLIEEAEELIEEEEGDAALIASAQKAEHYEIASYGTLAAWAVALGQAEAAQVLTGIMEEEKETDRKLTMIAQTVVNSLDTQRDSEAAEESEQEPREKRQTEAKRKPAKPRVAAKRPTGGGAKSKAGDAARSKRQTSRGGAAKSGGGQKKKGAKGSKAKSRK